jgi:hypothetical protein
VSYRDLELKYAGQLVRYLSWQLERHDQKCQVCYLLDECEKRKALRWYQSQTQRKQRELP